MTKSYEFTGRTTEEAINAGLAELDKDISDVTVDVLVEGSKGLFGLFGSRPAKVRLTVTEEDEEKASSIFEDMLKDAPAEPAEKKSKKSVKKQEPAVKETVPETKEVPAKAEEPVRSESSETAPVPAEKKESRKPARKPRNEKPREPREPKETNEPKDTEAETAQAEEAPVNIEPAPLMDPETAEGKAQQFLMKLTRLMGVEVQVYVTRDEEGNVRVNMMGDSKGILIGRRGETLDALQYLTSLQVNKGQSEYTRVTLDTENYRAKREEALTRLANRMANRCQKTGRRVSLEPMNPYERRVLHAALQNHPAVTTHSEGEEPNRHVVITLK